MAGYSSDYSMSNNAIAAYADGVKPLSKISIADLRGAGWSGTKVLATYLAKSGSWEPAEWHHSGGTWYNKVEFYDPVHLVELWNEMSTTERAATERAATERASNQSSAKADERPVEGTFTVWGGSRKHPRPIGQTKFTGVMIGNWIHINGGGRKKANGNHIRWKFI